MKHFNIKSKFARLISGLSIVALAFTAFAAAPAGVAFADTSLVAAVKLPTAPMPSLPHDCDRMTRSKIVTSRSPWALGPEI